MKNGSIRFPQGATLMPYPARTYKSKWHLNAYRCTHCQDMLSGKPQAYTLRLHWNLSIPASEAKQDAFDFCSEEHARLWLNDQLTQVQARNQARALAYRASLTETRPCSTCQKEFLINKYGYLVVPFFDIHSSTCEQCGVPLVVIYEDEGGLRYECSECHLAGSGSQYTGHSLKRCPSCEEERRKQNRQAYPLCPLCHTPTRVSDFLREYHGFTLDIIKVCCKRCIPQFEAMSQQEQMQILHQSIVKTYGETAVIYALQYDDSFICHHIGRTKHLKRRMSEYRRNWYREFSSYSVLEELPFGGLSMERELRWMLHALKHGWPIDNFDMYSPEKHTPAAEANEVVSRIAEIHEQEQQKKARLIDAMADIEPLEVPFEVIEPFLKMFTNTRDAFLVHWFVQQDMHSTQL